jgi:hypothetical protein
MQNTKSKEVRSSVRFSRRSEDVELYSSESEPMRMDEAEEQKEGKLLK